MAEVQKKKLDPKDEIITISGAKPARFYNFISKIVLNKFRKIELQALGETINKAIVVANDLVHEGVAEITKIDPSIHYDGDRGAPIKMTITLTATNKLKKID